MKRFLIFIVAVLLATPLFAAPAPIYSSRKDVRVVPGSYSIVWGKDGIKSIITFNKDGTYGHRHEYNNYNPYAEMMWMCGWFQDFEHTTTNMVAGDWKWNHTTRTLTLHEKWQDGSKSDRKFVFKFKPAGLETPEEQRPDDIYLRLQPLRE